MNLEASIDGLRRLLHVIGEADATAARLACLRFADTFEGLLNQAADTPARLELLSFIDTTTPALMGLSPQQRREAAGRLLRITDTLSGLTTPDAPLLSALSAQIHGFDWPTPPEFEAFLLPPAMTAPAAHAEDLPTIEDEIEAPEALEREHLAVETMTEADEALLLFIAAPQERSLPEVTPLPAPEEIVEPAGLLEAESAPMGGLLADDEASALAAAQPPVIEPKAAVAAPAMEEIDEPVEAWEPDLLAIETLTGADEAESLPVEGLIETDEADALMTAVPPEAMPQPRGEGFAPPPVDEVEEIDEIKEPAEALQHDLLDIETLTGADDAEALAAVQIAEPANRPAPQPPPLDDPEEPAELRAADLAALEALIAADEAEALALAIQSPTPATDAQAPLAPEDIEEPAELPAAEFAALEALIAADEAAAFALATQLATTAIMEVRGLPSHEEIEEPVEVGWAEALDTEMLTEEDEALTIAAAWLSVFADRESVFADRESVVADRESIAPGHSVARLTPLPEEIEEPIALLEAEGLPIEALIAIDEATALMPAGEPTSAGAIPPDEPEPAPIATTTSPGPAADRGPVERVALTDASILLNRGLPFTVVPWSLLMPETPGHEPPDSPVAAHPYGVEDAWLPRPSPVEDAEPPHPEEATPPFSAEELGEIADTTGMPRLAEELPADIPEAAETDLDEAPDAEETLSSAHALDLLDRLTITTASDHERLVQTALDLPEGDDGDWRTNLEAYAALLENLSEIAREGGFEPFSRIMGLMGERLRRLPPQNTDAKRALASALLELPENLLLYLQTPGDEAGASPLLSCIEATGLISDIDDGERTALREDLLHGPAAIRAPEAGEWARLMALEATQCPVCVPDETPPDALHVPAVTLIGALDETHVTEEPPLPPSAAVQEFLDLLLTAVAEFQGEMVETAIAIQPSDPIGWRNGLGRYVEILRLLCKAAGAAGLTSFIRALGLIIDRLEEMREEPTPRLGATLPAALMELPDALLIYLQMPGQLEGVEPLIQLLAEHGFLNEQCLDESDQLENDLLREPGTLFIAPADAETIYRTADITGVGGWGEPVLPPIKAERPPLEEELATLDDEDWLPTGAADEVTLPEEVTQAITSTMVAMPPLSEEAGEMLALLELGIAEIQADMERIAGRLAEADEETWHEEIAHYGRLLERLRLAAETIEFSPFHALCDRLMRVLAQASADPDAYPRRRLARALGNLPALLLFYITSPNSGDTVNSVVVSLHREGFLDDLTAEELEAFVIAITEGFHPESSLEAAPLILTQGELRLTPDAETDAAVLASVRGEAPRLAAELSGVIQGLTRGEVGPDQRPDALHRARRLAHTVKGSAAICGIRGIATLSHHLEDLLELLAQRGTAAEGGVDEGPAPEILRLLVEAADMLEAALDAVFSGEPFDRGAFARLVARTMGWALAVQRGLDEPVEVEAEGAPVEPAEVSAPETEVAAAPAAAPTPLPIGVDRETVDALQRQASEMAIALSQAESLIGTLRQGLEALAIQQRENLAHIETLEQLADVRGLGTRQPGAGKGRRRKEYDPLDLEEYNELYIATRRLNEGIQDARALSEGLDETVTRLDELHQRQTQINREVQEAVVHARRVPVQGYLPRLQRVVRQTCRATGHEAEMEVEGAELEIDNEILDDLMPALLHVLRNAIDHGIEPPEERIAAGKPPAGRLRLRLGRVGNAIEVQFSDDGRGLEYDAIRRRAVERGLLPADAEPNERELALLTLRPGFSTRTEVNQLSGRGVGMDVVDAAVRRLKGTLAIDSRRGEGYRLTLRLPTSTISLYALLVEAGGELFAVPSNEVRLAVALADGALERDGTEFVHDLGRFPVRRLGEMLGQRPGGDPRHPLALIVYTDVDEQVVLIDRLIDSREIVAKRLGRYAPPLPGIRNATVLGDGRIVPILELRTLLRHDLDAFRTEPGAEEPPPRIPRVLIVDDSLSMRRSLSLLVSDAGYEALTARDGLEALRQVDEEPPDVMLVDMEMPQMNGLELTQAVRERPAVAGLPIAMITSRATETHRRRALEAGVDHYFVKPYREDDILDFIATHLRPGEGNDHEPALD